MREVRTTESVVEEAALGWLEQLGYEVKFGPDITPGELFAERDSYDQVVLVQRLKDAIDRLNSTIPQEAKEDALRKLTVPHSPSLVLNNKTFHSYLTDGVPVEYLGEGRRRKSCT